MVERPVDPTRPGGPRRRAWLATALIAYLTLAAFPGFFLSARAAGPDPAWVYGLNILPETGYRFGGDLVFTHGPLARVMLPMVPPSSMVPSAVTWVVHALLLAAGFTYHYVRGWRFSSLAAAVATFVLALAFGVPYEYQVLLLLGVILLVPPADRRAWTIAAPLAASLVAVLLFVKTTTGLSAGAMLATASAWWLLRREARLAETALRVVVPFALVFAGLGVWLIGSPAEIAGWIRRTLQIASGFGNAMTVDVSEPVKLTALAGLSIFGVLAVATWRQGARDLLVPLLFAGPLYIAFRHSFVRHHGKFLVAYLMAIAAIALLVAASRRRLIHVSLAVALMAPVGLWASTMTECGCPFRPSGLGLRGVTNLAQTVLLGEVRDKLADTAERKLAVDRLPAEWVTRIDRAGEVDAIPWDISFVPANGLAWRPNPVVQTYHAFTSPLDTWVADHFATQGPPHLLVQFLEIDGRYPLWSAPEMWVSILSHYEPVEALGTVPGREAVLLMARREKPLDLGLTEGPTVDARFGSWVPIPLEDTPVFASFDLDWDLGGRLAAALWHTDPVLFEFRFEDGRKYTTRLLPGTAGGRHLANFPPLIFEQLTAMLEGTLPPRATAVRILGQGGGGSFEPDFRVTWWTSTWMPGDPP